MRHMAILAALLTPGTALAAPDPFETWNRRVHAFNAVVQARVLGPMAELWREHLPDDVRSGLGRAVANLGEPVTALSGLAAGDVALAGHALTRFGLNSTVGLGGWRDAATERGYARRTMTPGEALCAWGVPSGPYLVLPVLGPTTVRDAGAAMAVGTALAAGAGAAPVAGWQGAEAFLQYEDVQEELARVERESLDAYAVLRSATAQRRAARCAVDREGQE